MYRHYTFLHIKRILLYNYNIIHLFKTNLVKGALSLHYYLFLVRKKSLAIRRVKTILLFAI